MDENEQLIGFILAVGGIAIVLRMLAAPGVNSEMRFFRNTIRSIKNDLEILHKRLGNLFFNRISVQKAEHELKNLLSKFEHWEAELAAAKDSTQERVLRKYQEDVDTTEQLFLKVKQKIRNKRQDRDDRIRPSHAEKSSNRKKHVRRSVGQDERVDLVKCPNCGGVGSLPPDRKGGPHHYPWSRLTCPYCSGKKFVTAAAAEKYRPPSSCFIATCVYSGSDRPEVLVLRRYRDDVLLRSRVGRVLVRLYYKVAPSIALFLEYNDPFRDLTKALLDRCVMFIQKHHKPRIT